jgi:hypothetical protein
MTTDSSGPGPWEHELPQIEQRGVAMLHHEPSNVLFSLGEHGFRATTVRRYDRHARDISVRYASGPAAIVSIYVHPFPPPRTPALFDEYFNAAVTDMLRTMSSTSTVDERRTAYAHASATIVPGRRSEAVGSVRYGPTEFDQSFVEVFLHRAWMLKIRGTCRSRFRADVERFVASWLAASSFGTN